MDSERFDGLVRRVGQARSRRQTLRGLAGAGALVALLAATSGEDATAGELPHERLQDRTPTRNGKQRNQRQNNNNQNTSNNNTNGGRLGAVEPTQDCQEQCEEHCQGPCEDQCPQDFGNCVFGCGDDPDGSCLDRCKSDQATCDPVGPCDDQCEDQCFQACYRG